MLFWTKIEDKKDVNQSVSASLLLPDQTRLSLPSRDVLSWQPHTCEVKAGLMQTHTQAELWFARSIIDCPWGLHTWAEDPRVSVSFPFVFKSLHQFALWPSHCVLMMWLQPSATVREFSLKSMKAGRRPRFCCPRQSSRRIPLAEMNLGAWRINDVT